MSTLPNIAHEEMYVILLLHELVSFQGVSVSLSVWVTTIIGGGGSVGKGTARYFSLLVFTEKPSAEKENSR